jgi:hypothetical protein
LSSRRSRSPFPKAPAPGARHPTSDRGRARIRAPIARSERAAPANPATHNARRVRGRVAPGIRRFRESIGAPDRYWARPFPHVATDAAVQRHATATSTFRVNTSLAARDVTGTTRRHGTSRRPSHRFADRVGFGITHRAPWTRMTCLRAPTASDPNGEPPIPLSTGRHSTIQFYADRGDVDARQHQHRHPCRHGRGDIHRRVLRSSTSPSADAT